MAPGSRAPELRILPCSPEGGSGTLPGNRMSPVSVWVGALNLVCPAFLRVKRVGTTGTELSRGQWEKGLFSPE